MFLQALAKDEQKSSRLEAAAAIAPKTHGGGELCCEWGSVLRESGAHKPCLGTAGFGEVALFFLTLFLPMLGTDSRVVYRQVLYYWATFPNLDLGVLVVVGFFFQLVFVSGCLFVRFCKSLIM